MNRQLFKRCAEQLLGKHYMLHLNDTPFADDQIVANCIAQGIRPHQAVSKHAGDCGLDRFDQPGAFGVTLKAPLVDRNEVDALIALQAIFILSDQPTTCPLCGARTEFDELESGQQHHRCLDQSGCGHEFIAEDRADDDLVDEWPDDEDDGINGGERGSGGATVLNDRYAESIVGDRFSHYDALEVHGVRDLHAPGDPDGTCCEVDDENPQFYSVYVHIKHDRNAGGVECVGDFGVHALALAYANELAQRYRWPVTDYVGLRQSAPGVFTSSSSM